MMNTGTTTDELKIPVFLFTLLLFFQIVTAWLLFDSRFGWTKTSILNFYKLDSMFSQAQSFEGFLKTASPHLLSIGLITFLIIHFFAFTPHFSSRFRWFLGLGLGSFTFLDIFAGGFILLLGPDIYWLKIVSFLGFQLFFVGSVGVLFHSLICSPHSQAANVEN